MAAPETTELRAMGDEDLMQELEDTHQALFNLRFQTATRQLADVSRVHSARRRIARIKTLLTERDILAEADALLASDPAGDTGDTGDTGDEAAGDEAAGDEAAGDGAAGDEPDEATEEEAADGDEDADKESDQGDEG